MQSKTCEHKESNSRELINKIALEKEKIVDYVYLLSKIEILEMNKEIQEIRNTEDLRLDELQNDNENLDEFIDRVQEEIDLVNGKSSSHEKISNLKRLRAQCINHIEVISLYLIELDYIKDILEDILKHGNQNLVYENTFNLNQFYEDVLKFLTQDMDMLYDKIKDIIEVLPFRMTRDKYYDIVRKSIFNGLKHSSRIEVDIVLKRYRTTFNGTLGKDYGCSFDRFFRNTQNFKRDNYPEKSIDYISKRYQSIKEFIGEINLIYGIIRQCGMILNRIILIEELKVDNETFKVKDYVNLQKGLMNLYESKKFSNNKDFFQKYEKSIDNIKEDFVQSNYGFTELLQRYYDENDEDDEILQIIMEVQKILAYFNDYYIEEEVLMIYDDREEVDEYYLEENIENFIDFMDRNMKSMTNIQRKARMKKILSLLDKPFEGPEDFYKYLKSSIEFSTDNIKKTIIMNDIAKIMNRYEKSA
ncbi:hypothetical protein [Clostridiisalibacter paucivorans]|uniref:hypothetical protein n=1 Tax=Clostridiisalibacter paucivorans TaxID=408753 RepID=UPI0004796900|nr:hypothetical protein [Clostridiisalibacter paucivorans]